MSLQETDALQYTNIRHTLYVEQSGNPSGKPVIFVHGGSSTSANMAAIRSVSADIQGIIIDLGHLCMNDVGPGGGCSDYDRYCVDDLESTYAGVVRDLRW